MNAPALEPLLKDTLSTGKKILLLGLGNDILCDDAIGFHVTAEVRRRVAHLKNVEVVETAEMGLSLLDFIVGFNDLILVDAVQTGKAPAGFLHELDADDLTTLPTVSPHFLGVGEVIALGRKLGMAIPSRVKILAVEVEDPFTMSTQITPALQRALPDIVERVMTTVLELAGREPALANVKTL